MGREIINYGDPILAVRLLQPAEGSPLAWFTVVGSPCIPRGAGVSRGKINANQQQSFKRSDSVQ